MTGRKPTRKETTAAKLTVAAAMRGWLTDRRDAVRDQIARQRKADLLTGEGGGSGVTVTMRRISGEAAAREPHYIARAEGPNRAERRLPRNRSRHDRVWVPGPFEPGRWTGRTVWPTPPSQNTPYVAPRPVPGRDGA